MTLSPHTTYTYHVFLASPGDVGEERQHVRRFFERYNRHHARLWNVRFEVIDWENYATIGVGRPQELITQQTLEKYRDSLALVVGIMAQRFGMPTGEAESGTEEEFNWALESNLGSSWPEIKWFFRRVEKFVAPADPEEIAKALQQWNKVRAFRQRLQKNDPPVFYAQYPGPSGFRDVLENDLNLWLSDADRPWVPDFAARAVKPPAETAQAAHDTVPDEFDVSGYREALTDRFDVLNFEMLDVSGAYYGGVRLWNVFIPQSVRECHEYTPRLLEMPKEHVQLLVEKGELNAAELAEAEQMEDDRRRQYLSQPIRPVLEVVDDSSVKRCVILGDPGSGKSALLRFLALRWTRIRNDGQWDTLPVPLLIELRDYHRWDGGNDKSLLRYLQEGSSWHRLNQQTLSHLTDNPDRVTLLLDGLDEIFDPAERELVINDIQRFCCEFPDLRIVITSRVVGYRPQRLRDEKFQHFMIQDFDESQVDAFLGFWHDVTFERGDEARQKRERLLKAIKRSTSIAQLAGNPLLLTMMAILNRHQELPRDRSDLYQQCARLLLHQWDVERTLGEFPGLSAEIGLREKTDILRGVAYAMQTGVKSLLPSGEKVRMRGDAADDVQPPSPQPSPASGRGSKSANYIDRQTLESLIEDYLHTELHFDQARAAARALVEQLRARNFILCYLGADSYAFVHRTFLEYFCAADIVHQFNVAKTLSEQDLIALFDDHCRDDDWREVLRLICGQIDEQFVGRIVEHLATRTDLETWSGTPILSEFTLAINCIAEIRNFERIKPSGRILLEQVIRISRQVGGDKAGNQFVLAELIPACRELGSRWPGRDAFVPDLGHIGTIRKVSYGEELWTNLVAFVAADRDTAVALTTTTKGESEGSYIRRAALQALAEKWPDESTRELLAQRAVHDDHQYPRSAALQALAEKWPDETTRALLAQRAVQDKDGRPRGAALRALAEKWPDETTRELLARRAVQDDNEHTRSGALQALAEKWPDETTLRLLESQVSSFEEEWFRQGIEKSIETLRRKLAE